LRNRHTLAERSAWLPIVGISMDASRRPSCIVARRVLTFQARGKYVCCDRCG
jgi:hypothetical protein